MRAAEKAREARWNFRLRVLALGGALVLVYLSVTSAISYSTTVERILFAAVYGLPALLLLAYVVGIFGNIPVDILSAPRIYTSYVAPPKSKLVVICLGMALFGFALLYGAWDAIDLGRITEDGKVYMRAADPGPFWRKVAFLLFCGVFCTAVTLVSAMMLIRHPDPPFGARSRKSPPN